MSIVVLKKFKLINGVSPLVKLNYKIGKTSIFMKRDDLLDFYFGGNKVRLYEYIMQEVKSKNVEKLITFGSIHSNHVRVTAAVAAYCNIDCDLIIIKEKENGNLNIEGNSLLMSFLNVNIYECYSDEAREYIDKHLENQEKKNINYFFVPGGGHLPIAAMGYVDALEEIIDQSEILNVEMDAIFTPTGTGTTQAGLIYGKKTLGFNGDIIGVTVARDPDKCKYEITKMLEGLNLILEKDVHFGATEDIKVIDNCGKRYGIIDNDIIQIMREIAVSEGILLDPIYNAKSFWVMQEMILKKELQEYKNVLYLNTGGSPNIFTQEVHRKVE